MSKQNESLKRCSKCEEWKPRIEFNKHMGSRDALESRCKKCRKKYDKARRMKHKEKNKERNVTIGPPKKCPKCEKLKPRIEFNKAMDNQSGLSSYCIECMKTYHKKYHLKNKEKINEYHRKRYFDYRNEVRFLHGISAQRAGFLKGDGCCLWCFNYDPRVLHNHHIWGRKNSDDTFTFCANCHEHFTRDNGVFLEFLVDLS